MGYGQHSAYGQPALTKSAMLARAAQSTGFMSPIKSSRMAGRNTLEVKLEDGTTILQYHDTNIVTAHNDGSIVIKTGGWNTLTTRARIHTYSIGGKKLTASTDKGVLSLGYREGDTYKKLLCIDTLVIKSNGDLISDMPQSDIVSRKHALDLFMKDWKAKGLPRTSAGDPWVFADATKKVSADTMLEWVTMRYVFRNFLLYALHAAGISQTGISYTFDQIDRNGGKLDALQLGRVRRYARRCMGFA